MSESNVHTELVNKCVDWIIKTVLDGNSGCLYIDKPDLPSGKRPPLINGYVPDIMITKNTKYGIIIGEAKTANDIDNQHTFDQLIAFFMKCSEYDSSLFVFAVPWYRLGLAKSTVVYCSRFIDTNKMKIVYPDKLP